MSWIKKQYPVGKELGSFPHPAGDFPATVEGYGSLWDEKNSGFSRRATVRVVVHGQQDGKKFEDHVGFDTVAG